MVRAPCCEKMGLKKGPWIPEEDQILINYIQQYGHGNWRALPKLAGLLRCGKSCRLRWKNYLRPDIKRGNFTREEEDTIIKLHETLGNRWSAIAARLPGRTDNEIKNVWHTHLKKRLKQNNNSDHGRSDIKRCPVDDMSIASQESRKEPELINSSSSNLETPECSSDISSVTTGEDAGNNNMPSMKIESTDNDFQEMDENFWSEVLSTDNSSSSSDFTAAGAQLQIPFYTAGHSIEPVVQYDCHSSMCDSTDFWYNLFTRAGESLELPEI